MLFPKVVYITFWCELRTWGTKHFNKEVLLCATDFIARLSFLLDLQEYIVLDNLTFLRSFQAQKPEFENMMFTFPYMLTAHRKCPENITSD